MKHFKHDSLFQDRTDSIVKPNLSPDSKLRLHKKIAQETDHNRSNTIYDYSETKNDSNFLNSKVKL